MSKIERMRRLSRRLVCLTRGHDPVPVYYGAGESAQHARCWRCHTNLPLSAIP